MRIIFFIILLSIFSFAEKTQQIKPLPKELQGNIIPSFLVLEGNNIGSLKRNDLKKNAEKADAKRIVLSFFDTYCVHCWEEFKVLKDNSEELKKQGVLVYLINAGQSIDSSGIITEMVKEYTGNTFPLYFDPDRKELALIDFGLAEKGKDYPLPLILILDKDLKVLSVLIGKMGKDFPQILWGEF